jgi:hypothetical protein
MSSGVLKKVFSIITISLNGEYVTATSGLLIKGHINRLARCWRLPFNLAVASFGQPVFIDPIQQELHRKRTLKIY